MYSLQELLSEMISRNASDLHLTVGAPPVYRVHGDLVRIDGPELTPGETKHLSYSILTDEQKERFEERHELDFSFGLAGVSRFRVNMYHQRGAVAASFRVIPFTVASIDELGLPDAVTQVAEKRRGLFIVSGPTGSGKSSSLAALIDVINRTRPVHVVTVEDPIEYIHTHDKAIVDQREVHADTESFASALKYIQRQDPDVVMVGELSDQETVASGLCVAEAGHLLFATMHTTSATATINRLIDIFPPHRQPQIRAQLALVLEGVLCQQLVQRSDGAGRVLAYELLIPTPAIRNLIRDDRIHQVYSFMQDGHPGDGMMTMSRSLVNLYADGAISLDDAVGKALFPEEVEQMVEREGLPGKNARR